MVEQFPEYWAWRKKFNKRTWMITLSGLAMSD